MNPEPGGPTTAHEAMLQADMGEIVLAIIDERLQVVYGGAGWGDVVGAEHGPRDWAAAVHPDDIERLEATFFARGLPRPGDPPLELEYRIMHPERGLRWLSTRLVARFRAGGEFAGLMLTGSDVTELYDAKHRVEQMVAEQDALRRLATSVAAQGTLAEVGELAARLVAQLMPRTGAVVARFDAEHCWAVGSHGIERWFPAGFPEPFPLAYDTTFGRVHRTGSFARIDDHGRGDVAEPGRALARQIGATSAMSAPIVVDGVLWGALQVSRDDGALFATEQETQLVRFAELVSIAVAGAQARERLHQLAMTDPLTGLANRRLLIERLDGCLAAWTPDHPVTLALVDVDGLKRINDVFGHERGDQTIVEVAEVLLATAAADDLVARLGGDEFAWLMDGADLAQAEDAVGAARSQMHDPRSLGASISISAGLCPGVAGLTARQWMQWADTALYDAKTAGRGVTRTALARDS